jgi:DHA1 family bicyclomycin/chloramphenicol resistance-like MFS transporter
VVTSFGWRGTFVFQAALGVALLLATHIALRESRPVADIVPLSVANVIRSYLRMGADRKLMGYSLVGGFGMGALFAYVAGAPTVLTHRYDLSPQQFGALMLERAGALRIPEEERAALAARIAERLERIYPA